MERRCDVAKEGLVVTNSGGPLLALSACKKYWSYSLITGCAT